MSLCVYETWLPGHRGGRPVKAAAVLALVGFLACTLIPFLLAKNSIHEPDTRSPGPLVFATQEFLLIAQQAFWSCASGTMEAAE